MSTRAESLRAPEGWGSSFTASTLLHLCVLALAFGWAWWNKDRILLGSPDSTGGGFVGVNVVTSVPIHQERAPENRLTTRDTENRTPERIEKKKSEVEDDSGIPLLKKNAKKKKKADLDAIARKLPQEEPPDRLTSDLGRKATTEMFQVPGVGNLGTGNSDPFGQGLGWYATRLRQALASKWNISDVPQYLRRKQITTVAFTIQRDGRISGARVVQSAGNGAADSAALRAVLAIDPFVPLPPAFTRAAAQVEYQFELNP